MIKKTPLQRIQRLADHAIAKSSSADVRALVSAIQDEVDRELVRQELTKALLALAFTIGVVLTYTVIFWGDVHA